MDSFKADAVLSYGKLRYIVSGHVFRIALDDSHTMVKTRATLAHAGYFGGRFDKDAYYDGKGGYAEGYDKLDFYAGLPSRPVCEKTKAAFKETGAIEWAHAHSIAVVGYIGGTRFAGDEEKRTLFFEFYDRHWQEYEDYFGPKPAEDPAQWTRLLSSGQRAVHTNPTNLVTQYDCCINNPCMRDYIKGCIRMDIEMGIDGIFIDNSPKFCYCPRCVNRFREHLRTSFSPHQLKVIFEIEDPSEADPVAFTRGRYLRLENPLYVEWRRFRPQNYLEWMKEMRDYGRSQKEDFFFAINACLWEGNPYRQFEFAVGPLEEWIKESDYIFIEGMFETSPYGSTDVKITNSPVLKYAVAASRGKPVTFDCYMTWSKTPEMMIPLTKLAVAECQANRTSFIHNWSPHQNLPWGEDGTYIYADLTKQNEAMIEALGEYNGFLATNEDLFVGSEPYANVGVLCSLQQAYGKRKTSFMAISRMLSDEQIPHVALIDDDLTGEQLASFAAVILPEVPMLGDAQVEAISRFVRNGGGLVLFGETAAFDQYGRLRKKFYGFHKLLENLEPWGHIDTGIDPATGVNTTGKAVCGEGRVVNIPRDAYVSFPDIGREKVVLFKDMASITTGAMKSINTVFGDIVRWVAKDGLSGTCSADSTVEFALMNQPERSRAIVHLVNYKVDLDGRVVEEKDIALKAAMPEGKKPISVQLISPDFPERPMLDFVEKEESGLKVAEFTVPQLVIYDLVVVEYE
jgi:hypothetical protein